MTVERGKKHEETWAHVCLYHPGRSDMCVCTCGRDEIQTCTGRAGRYRAAWAGHIIIRFVQLEREREVGLV